LCQGLSVVTGRIYCITNYFNLASEDTGCRPPQQSKRRLCWSRHGLLLRRMRPLSYREAHGCRAVRRREELHGLAPAREVGFTGGAGEQLRCRTATRASRSRWRRGGRVVEHLQGGAGREGRRALSGNAGPQGWLREPSTHARAPDSTSGEKPSSIQISLGLLCSCACVRAYRLLRKKYFRAYVLQSFYTKTMVEGYFWDKNVLNTRIHLHDLRPRLVCFC
jgi:hypothetical protein